MYEADPLEDGRWYGRWYEYKPDEKQLLLHESICLVTYIHYKIVQYKVLLVW